MREQHQGYLIENSKEELSSVPRLLRANGLLSTGTMEFYRIPCNIEEEELHLKEQDPCDASALFEKNRAEVLGTLRAIAGCVMARFDIPRKNGIDVGCGATGGMIHQLLKGLIDEHTWAEVDLNPRAIKTLLERYPRANAFEGSYHRVGNLGLHENLDIITGLSSLDTTQFIEHAIEELQGALKKGGYLLHIQDVRPGLGTGWRELRRKGMESPYSAELLDKTSNENAVFAYKTPNEVVTTGELFRRALGRALEQNSRYQLLMNDWVRATRKLEGETRGKLYYMNILLTVREPVEDASAVVTVARKVS